LTAEQRALLLELQQRVAAPDWAVVGAMELDLLTLAETLQRVRVLSAQGVRVQTVLDSRTFFYEALEAALFASVLPQLQLLAPEGTQRRGKQSIWSLPNVSARTN